MSLESPPARVQRPRGYLFSFRALSGETHDRLVNVLVTAAILPHHRGPDSVYAFEYSTGFGSFRVSMGFKLVEISLLQYFSIYLGHPIYSLGVCLFSLILATALKSISGGVSQLEALLETPIRLAVQSGIDQGCDLPARREESGVYDELMLR
jgi:hypothetical protein